MSTTLSALLANLVLKNPNHKTRQYAALSGIPMKRCCALLGTLKKRGWLVQRFLPVTHRGSGGLEGRWFPTTRLQSQPYPAAKYLDTADVVLDAMGGQVMKVDAIVAAVDRPYNTVRHALERLIADGRVTVVGVGKSRARLYQAATPVVEEDDDWTPQPYINPIRARALGKAA